MEQSVMALLIRRIDEEQLALTHALSAGAVKDFAEYKGLCGQVAGLARARYIVEEMRVRLKDQDD